MLSEESQHKKIKNIFVASDHAGLEMKDFLIGRFPFQPWTDLGTTTSTSVDYPDFAEKLALAIKDHLQDSVGVLICGSGQGICMAANRFWYLRAALCWSVEVAELARQHNDANVLCLGGRLTPFPVAEQILTAFLKTDFEAGRHQARVQKLTVPRKT